MANQEHLALLKQGRASWNQWRVDHPEIEPDLREVDFEEIDLTGVDLKGADLRGSLLSREWDGMDLQRVTEMARFTKAGKKKGSRRTNCICRSLC